MPHLPDHQIDHDPLLIAAFASGDAEGADLEQARDLVAACDECAALHHDLRSIATAMPALPAQARPRDFRLSPEQAASIRPAGWRRLLAPLAGPRFAFAAPLGGSLAALGIAGILVAGAAGTPLAGVGDGAAMRQASPAPTQESRVEALSGAASEAPPAVPGDAAFVPAPSPAVPVGGTGPAGGEPAIDTGPAEKDPGTAVELAPDVPASSPSSGPAPIVQILSVVLLFLGGVLVGLRLAGRRLGART